MSWESTVEVISVLLPEKWFEQFKPMLQRRPEDIQVFLAPKQQLEQLTGFSFYQGVLAAARELMRER